jgi:hypothetical protein
MPPSLNCGFRFNLVTKMIDSFKLLARMTAEDDDERVVKQNDKVKAARRRMKMDEGK